MPPYSALVLAAAGLVAGQGLTAMNLGDVLGRGVTHAGLGSSAFGINADTSTCGIGQTDCDTGCMPLTGICCGLGNGAYCDIGYSCVSDGCCPVGKVCTGAPSGCEGDRDLCGEFCVPKGTCTSGGDGGGNGGGSGGDGGDGGCPTGYEACDDECMPSGSVCCHNGFHCDAGQTCTADFQCQLGSGGGGDGGDGGDNQSSSPGDSFTSDGSGGSSSGSQTSYSLSPNPEPTAAPTQSSPFGSSGGDDNTSDPFSPVTSNDGQPSPTDNGGSPFTSNAGPVITSELGRPARTSASRPTSTNGASGEVVGSSGLLVGLLAFIPFVL